MFGSIKSVIKKNSLIFFVLPLKMRNDCDENLKNGIPTFRTLLRTYVFMVGNSNFFVHVEYEYEFLIIGNFPTQGLVDLKINIKLDHLFVGT